jgi:coenzyme F420-reducing hydrogenase delta subunit
MIKAFETGADGVVVVACKAGDCTYLEGSPRAAKRAGAADRLLEEIGLGKGRVAFVELDHGDEPVLEEAFGRFADRLFQLCRKETGSREPVRSLPV